MYWMRPKISRAPVAYNDVFIVAPKTVVRSTKKKPRNNTIWVMFEGNQWTDVVMSIGWDGEDKQKLFKVRSSQRRFDIPYYDNNSTTARLKLVIQRDQAVHTTLFSKWLQVSTSILPAPLKNGDEVIFEAADGRYFAMDYLITLSHQPAVITMWSEPATEELADLEVDGSVTFQRMGDERHPYYDVHLRQLHLRSQPRRQLNLLYSGLKANILPMGMHRLIMCENGRLTTERFDAPDPTPAVDFHIHAVVVTKFSLNWTEQTRSVELPFEIDLVDDGCLQIVGNYTELNVYENVGRLDRESRKVTGDQTTTTYWSPEWTPLRVETLVGDLYRMVTPIELSIDGLQWKPNVLYDVTKLCLIPTRQPPYETIRQELNETDDMLLAELAEVEEDEEGYDDFLDDLFDEESEHDAEQFDC